MRKRTSRFHSDTARQEDSSTGAAKRAADISLLQRPLRTAHTSAGFEEARRAFEDGTTEVRQLLSEECSLIYECNVCRNMFRSLANFISHKRVYCCIRACTINQNGYTDQNSTMIIQAPGCNGSCETSSAGIGGSATGTGNGGGVSGAGNINTKSRSNSNTIAMQEMEVMLRSRSTGCSPVPRDGRLPLRGSCMRDLSGVIERLRREKAQPLELLDDDSAVLQLETVPTSSHAVYQTIKREQSADSIKTEVDEVHQMLSPVETIVGPDGKALTSRQFEQQNDRVPTKNAETAVAGSDGEANILCEICSLTFQTQKTLELHIQKHHSSTTFVFQCPACSLTFLQAAAVIRHLSKDHKKPSRRIRRMRDNILKRRMQQGEVQPKGPNRELKRLQMSSDFKGAVAEVDGSAVGDFKVMSLCIYCEKSFERRAALSTHLLNCRAKQEALAKPAPNVKRLKTKANGNHAGQPPVEASVNNTADAVVDSSQRSLGEMDDVPSEADVNTLNEMFADLAEQNENYAAGLQTVSLDKLNLQDSDSTADEDSNIDDKVDTEQSVEDEAGAATNVGDTSKTKKKRHVPVEKQQCCRCKQCNKEFNSLGNLRRHISMFHYRSRRFGCALCEYRAFRRFDIVTHLDFAHKIEGKPEELSEKYISTHEYKRSRDDVNNDIVLLEAPPPSDKDQEKEQEQQPASTNSSADAKATPNKPTGEKPKENLLKRLKTIQSHTEQLLAAVKAEPRESVVEPKEEEATDQPTNKKRHKSRIQHSPDSSDHPLKTTSSSGSAEKRSTRKRVKAVNKDFVYDLVSFKANGSETPLLLSPPPANNPPIAENNMRAKLRRPNPTHLEDVKPKLFELCINEAKKLQIPGSAQRLMMHMVYQGLATSATLPELPAERPQIRPRPNALTRRECGQTITQMLDTVAASSNDSTGESIVEKLAKRSAAAVAHNLWQKVNTAIAQQQEQPSHGDTYQPPSSQMAHLKASNGQRVANTQLHEEPSSPPPKMARTEFSQYKNSFAAPATPTSLPTPPTAIECLSGGGEPVLVAQPPLPLPTATPTTMPTPSMFPALPRAPSLLASAATNGGTINLTLDSLLRAALQN